MSTRSVSPGGALLRASRVFAIPPPLPQPSGDLSSTAIFNSDSATLPHPTHLSITTPTESLKRGDWGFKRPLPLRSTTRTSTPFIRVKAIDTFEHITEFGSAADHTLSLQKWQEMGIPLSTPLKSNSVGSNFPDEKSSGKTVFEDKYDTIAFADGEVRGKDDVRWKFKGPWLAGMNEGEFNTYVSKEVRKRKDEFRKFLRNACAVETTQAQYRAASERGDDFPLAIQASDITHDELTEYIMVLRKDTLKLKQHIRCFLDLPPSAVVPTDFTTTLASVLSGSTGEVYKDVHSDSPYAGTGPPKTHPSAGLAYNRSPSHLFNHPVYGPQRYQPPVQARVVMPRAAATGSFAPVLGVGGFVTNVPSGTDNSFNINNIGRGKRAAPVQIPGLQNVEPEKEGGSKAWVHPTHARIDPKGRVILNVEMGDAEAIAVLEGTVGDIPTQHRRPAPLPFANHAAAFSNFSGGYGLNLSRQEDRRAVRADNDALKKLSDLVGGSEKGKFL